MLLLLIIFYTSIAFCMDEEESELLWNSAISNDVNTIKKLAQKFPHELLYEQDMFSSSTLLIKFIEQGCYQGSLALVEEGARLDVVNKKGNTALFLASTCRDTFFGMQLTKLLLSKNAPLKIPQQEENNFIKMIEDSSDISVNQRLLKKMYDEASIDSLLKKFITDEMIRKRIFSYSLGINIDLLDQKS